MPLRVTAPKGEANALNVRVGDGPEYVELDPEPADDPLRPTPVVVPGAINGRFASMDDGDIDFYRLMPAPGARGTTRSRSTRRGSARRPIPCSPWSIHAGNSQAEDDDKLGRGCADRAEDRGRRAGHRRPRGVPTGRPAVRLSDRGRSRSAPQDHGRRRPRGPHRAPKWIDRGADHAGTEDDDGPVTILAGDLPPGVSAVPVTIPAKGRAAFLVLSASSDAPLGPFPFRLAVRDVRGSAEVSYRERGRRRGPPKRGPDGKPEPDNGSVEVRRPVLAIAEPTALGLSIDPADITIDRREIGRGESHPRPPRRRREKAGRDSACSGRGRWIRYGRTTSRSGRQGRARLHAEGKAGRHLATVPAVGESLVRRGARDARRGRSPGVTERAITFISPLSSWCRRPACRLPN